jgi:hypothetical protein
MDDRTTTAYSPRAHAFMPRPAAASLSEGRMLRAAPPATVSARARADDAGLMWLDDADLLSVSEPSAPAAESGSIAAMCILPGLGLFAAVLFGQLILAASASQPLAPRAAAPSAESPQPLNAPENVRSQRRHDDGAHGAGAGETQSPQAHE